MIVTLFVKGQNDRGVIEAMSQPLSKSQRTFGGVSKELLVLNISRTVIYLVCNKKKKI